MSRRWGVLAVIALALLALWYWHAQLAAAASLATLTLAASVLPGCLLLALVVPLVQGRWQALLLPGVARCLPAMPLVLLWLIPLLAGLPLLYSWAGEHPGGFRGVWLSPWFFALRAVGYGFFWCVAARATHRRQPGWLIAHVAINSLAAVDWQMSLLAEFNSAVFGLLLISRQVLDGLALAGWLALRRGPDAEALAVLRGLLLAALALSLYLHYMQYLVIWSVNLPHELAWYQLRSTPLWSVCGVAVFACQIGVFGLLLTPLGKRAQALLTCCVLTLLGSALQASWLSLPSLEQLNADTALLAASVLQAGFALLLWAWLAPRRGVA
jgi:hypothetical protein